MLTKISTSLLLTLISFSIYANDIVIEDARVDITKNNASSTKAFMFMINYSKKQAISLTKVTSPDVETIEMLSRKKPTEQIKIKPAKAVSLEPTGYHLQLKGLKSSLKKGDQLPLTLSFSDGSSYLVKAIAVEPGTHVHHDGKGNTITHYNHNNDK